MRVATADLGGARSFAAIPMLAGDTLKGAFTIYRQHDLGVGFGLATGYATLGLIGSASRSDYTAIGTVVNVASRLCDEAAMAISC